MGINLGHSFNCDCALLVQAIGSLLMAHRLFLGIYATRTPDSLSKISHLDVSGLGVCVSKFRAGFILTSVGFR